MSGAEFFRHLLALDAQLVAAGHPPLSRWWRRVLKKFFESSRKRLVLRVGRRGGKSLTMAKIAVAVALANGLWSVSPGDIGVIPFLSVDKNEASSRLRTIASMLTSLGVPFARRDGEVELTDGRPVLFKVAAASVTATVGFTSLSVFCDEVSRWRDQESNVNPMREVLASISPTTATVPSARIFLCSSPWSTTDGHAEAFARGEDDFQMVAHAASWTANPTISEKQSRALEPDERIWLREYAALPSDSVSSVCTVEEYDRCVSRGVTSREPITDGSYVTCIDVGLRNDSTAILSAHREMQETASGDLRDVLVVDRLTVLSPGIFKRVTLEEVVSRVVEHHRAYGGHVVGDIFYSDSVRTALEARGIRFQELSSSSSAITARVTALAVRFGSGTLALVDDERLRKEILQAQLVLRQGGHQTLKAPERRGHHDDCVSALLLACDPEVVALLPYTSGNIHVEYSPVHWSPETHTISGAVPRYFSRAANGQLTPHDPPFGSADFVAWAEGMVAQGLSTPSIEKWKRENRRDEPGVTSITRNIIS